MLHGILRVRKAVLHNDVVLEVLEVTLTVRLAQARRRAVFSVSVFVLSCEPFTLGEVLALTAEDGPHNLSISLSFHVSLLHVTIRHVSLHQRCEQSVDVDLGCGSDGFFVHRFFNLHSRLWRAAAFLRLRLWFRLSLGAPPSFGRCFNDRAATRL